MESSIIILVIILTFSGCNNRSAETSWQKTETSQDTLYDVIRGELVHETEDTIWFEPYESKTLKIRNIYKKGKIYTYKAIYKDSNGKELSNSTIKVIPSSERIAFAPERQDRVTYVYENYEKDSQNLSNHNLNKEYQDWTYTAEEGIIENVERVWIHPMRQNQYKFTEVAPFPDVRLPLELNKTWETTLNIGNSYGEWANSSGISEYEVINKGALTFEDTNIEYWEIKSKSSFPFGVSELNYKFNENLGFIEMKYKNYAGEKLDIKMVEIE